MAENFKELFDFYFFITGQFRFCYLGAVFFVGNDSKFNARVFSGVITQDSERSFFVS